MEFLELGTCKVGQAAKQFVIMQPHHNQVGKLSPYSAGESTTDAIAAGKKRRKTSKIGNLERELSSEVIITQSQILRTIGERKQDG